MNTSSLKCILVLVMSTLTKSEDVDILHSLSLAFGMKNTLLINSPTRNYAISWMKTISSKNQFSSTSFNHNEYHVENYQNIIVVYDGSNFKH